jgi:hypothetical protein
MSLVDNLNRSGLAQSQMGVLQNMLASKRERRLARAKQKANRAAYAERANLGYAKTIRSESRAERLDALANQPVIEANNTVDNTVAAAPVAAPATLDPMSRQPMDVIQPLPNIQEQTTPEDVATYGVAGAAQSMFGTPMQRQMSMGGSLMKRACKYKNKK